MSGGHRCGFDKHVCPGIDVYTYSYFNHLCLFTKYALPCNDVIQCKGRSKVYSGTSFLDYFVLMQAVNANNTLRLWLSV